MPCCPCSPRRCSPACPRGAAAAATPAQPKAAASAVAREGQARRRHARPGDDPAGRRQLHLPPAAEVQAAVARAKALGVDTIRLTAGWSSLTRDVDQPVKPAGFDARDPGRLRAEPLAGARHRRPRDPRRRPAPARSTSASGRRAGRRPIPARARGRTSTRRRTPTSRSPSRCATRAASRRRPIRRARRRREPTPDQSLVQSILQPLLPFPIPDPLAAAARARGRARALAGRRRAGARRAPAERRRLHPLERAQPPGPAAAAVGGRRTTPASPRVYRAMLRAGYAAVKSVRKQVQGADRQHVEHRRGAARRRRRRAAGVPARARVRRPPDAAAHDRRLRELHDAARRRLGAPPVLAERAPVARSRSRRLERDHLRMADLPALATTLDILVKMGRIAPANRNIHLTEFGYETQPVMGRPTIDELHAGALADVGGVPRRQGADRALLRAVPPARPAAGAGARLDERGAAVRPVLDGAAARRRQGQDRGEDVPRRPLRAAAQQGPRAALRPPATRGRHADGDRPAPASARRVEADRHAEDRRPLGLHAHDPARHGQRCTGSAIRLPGGRRTVEHRDQAAPGRRLSGPPGALQTLLPSRAACLRLPSLSARDARRPRRSSPRPA